MSIYDDFRGCSWVGVPAELYKGRNWDGRLRTQTAYFRRTFKLNGPGARLTLHISAATRYRLYVNGKSLLSGPCKGDRFRHYYETIDVSEHLAWGDNVIAVKVVAYPPYDAAADEHAHGLGPQFAFGSASGPCLLVGGEALSRDNRRLASVCTGEAAWSVCLDDAIQWETSHLTFWMGGMEVVDGARLPANWANPQAPGGVWAPADVRWPIHPNGTGGIMPYPLLPRPIPLLYEKTIDFQGEKPFRPSDVPPFSFVGGPAVIPPHTRMAIELDVGVLTTAYVSLPMSGGRGAEIIQRYAECYSDGTRAGKGDRCDSVNYQLHGHQDVYRPSGGEETYVPFWFRTMRFLRVEVQTADEPLTLEKPTLLETGYPLESRTTFHSSDPALNTLWEISKRTLQRCMHETYEDCPYYEQLQYTMDTRLQMLFTYALSGDTRMARRTIDDYHASILPEGILQSRYPCQVSQVIPIFALHWVFMLEDYYVQTGDLSVPRRYRPTIDNVLDWYARHIDHTSLVGPTEYWQFTDWVEAWEGQFGMSFASYTGPSVSNNLTYVLAMGSAARINRLTGRNDAASAYEADAKAILANVQKHCWDAAVGLYREGPGVDEFTQHAQVLAVLTGLATGEKAKALMQKALEQPDLRQCSFPWMFYFLRALEQAGMYERSLIFYDRLIHFVNLNATTIPECHYQTRSECHAWGAFPLYEFPRTLLGVNPGSPGWGEILIRPFFGIAPDCGGTVSTPVGEVEVAWQRRDGKIELKGRAPEGVPCVVELPDGRRVELPEGGTFVERF
ncbi:MAG: hypothetical protein FWD25_02820 [Clostridia bacterium]|nr:hypothetical protein [Clostridia bacterium]